MKILVIRRDNIGDLVCTTPAFSSLRQAFPQAYIAALVNSYSAPVIANNPDINDVFIYTKGKHGANAQGILRRWKTTFCLLYTLRACQFDVIIAIGKSSATLARLLSPKRIISAGEPGPTDVISEQELLPLHAVQAAHKFLTPMGIECAPGPLSIFANTDARMSALPTPSPRGKRIIGLHLSARKPSQRWSVENFVSLANRLSTAGEFYFLVFWSPGAQSNPQHPGDDEKAEAFQLTAGALAFQLCPTTQLEELITAMSQCDLLICGDGGAMHIAAALGKPIVALFGDSDPQRWRPWGVPCHVLQDESRQVRTISVDAVFHAARSLLESTGPSPLHANE
jgi:heptosyltransferase-3